MSPPQQSLLAQARQSGDMLSGLVIDILDMAQMEAGRLAIRPGLFDLRQLLDGCAEVFAPRAAERGITLQVAVAAGTPATLLTDPGRLRQVLLNLLSNALKHARPGEVWLTRGTGTRRIAGGHAECDRQRTDYRAARAGGVVPPVPPRRPGQRRRFGRNRSRAVDLPLPRHSDGWRNRLRAVDAGGRADRQCFPGWPSR